MRRHILTLLACMALALPQMAVAQGQDFYRYQYNSTIMEFNKVVDRVNSLKTDMNNERDFTRGCAMMGSLISYLADAQILAEKLAEYANQLGDADGHRQAVDLHNAYLEERHHWENQRSRMCS